MGSWTRTRSATVKESCHFHTLKFSNPFVFAIWWCKLLKIMYAIFNSLLKLIKWIINWKMGRLWNKQMMNQRSRTKFKKTITCPELYLTTTGYFIKGTLTSREICILHTKEGIFVYLFMHFLSFCLYYRISQGVQELWYVQDM